MAETDSAGCRCSNISIMQLFHELKQRFPKVPDQIVSKVIQQNFHDKTACETLLQRESNLYVQCYPGALISGDGRSLNAQGPISDHCTADPSNPKTHLPPRRSSDTGYYDQPLASPLRQRVADGATATALPYSQQQTDSDVSALLPLSAAHACGARTPPYDLSHSTPLASRGTPDEDELSTDEKFEAQSPDSGGSTATPCDDSISSPYNPAGGAPRKGSRSRPRSLEEKLELARIPLGQLVREARERVTVRAGSEQKKGCEVPECSDVSPSVGGCEPCVVAPMTPPTGASGGLSCDKCPRRLSFESDESSNQTPSTLSPNPTSSKEGTPSPLAEKGLSDCAASPICDSPLKKSPEHATPTRPNTLPCDISRLQVDPSQWQPHPVVREQPQSAPKDTSPVSAIVPAHTLKRTASSTSNQVSSPNRLVPPSSTNPYLYPSFPSHVSAPSNDHSANRSPHYSNDVLLQPQISGHFLRTPPADAPKEYEVAVECVVCPGTPGDKQRSFTSVNLTLRPPSVETTLPIDISSGQSLTYTSASFDPRQGYQSHLQIRIGPALLQQQRERKELLAHELRRKKERLSTMQVQVQAMKQALARAASRPIILSKLKADIERLRVECERLSAAVDAYTEQNNANNLPLGETDEDFYRNIYTGQQQHSAGWSCRVCTFRNHPLLSVCEECEMPRLSLGTALGNAPPTNVPSNPVFSNINNSSCAAGETSTSVSRTITPLQER